MISKRILGFLIPAFIVSLIYGYLQMPQQERVTTGEDKDIHSSTKKQQQGQTTAVNGSVGYPRLRSDLLERKSQAYPGVRRDLFSAAFAVSEREEKVEVLPEEALEVIAPPVVVAIAPPPPSPQEIAQQELARYKFVGFFRKGEKKTIFLSTAGEILLVRKGEYLGRDRKYFVVDISDTNLELRKDGAGDFSIKLTDQEALSAIPLPTASPGTSGRSVQGQEQERNLPDQPESLPATPGELPTEDQLQPEEENK